MIEIEDIKDQDSLRQWLKDWPLQQGLDEAATRAIAVSIVHRASMRVLPLWWAWTLTDKARKRDFSALPVLRCNLISGVAASVPTPKIKKAAAAASTTAASTTAAAATVAGARATATTAAAAAEITARATAAAAAATTAAGARATATTAASAADETTARVTAAATAWHSIRADCAIIAEGRDVLAAPLWADRDNLFEDRWGAVKTDVTTQEWAFWIKWYDDALAGRAQNWKMLEQIALIESEVWEVGAEAVAAAISEIEAEFKTAPDPVEPEVTPEQAIADNSNVISLQLDTLMLFVEEEIRKLRGSNTISEVAMKRITLFEGLLDAIRKMQEALADEAADGANALVVFEDNLPQVFETADDLASNGDAVEISETLVVIGATIAYLTKRGTPGNFAAGFAVVDVVGRAIKGYFTKTKSPKG